MGEWLQEYINQLKDLWQKLNKRAKIIIGISILGVILALGFLVIWSGGSSYKPLFGQLNAQDADAITDRLDEQGIDYKLTDNGSTVMVPASRVHKTRLEMAGEGLPDQGVVGFEIFDQSQFGTTDFERKVNYYRAVSGELTRSIQSMDNVEFARVQITAPKESLYIEEEKPAEASVLLKLNPGYDINQNSVKAITNLVASSVQGLNNGNVTIVDTAGNLLTAGMDKGRTPSSNQMTMNQFQIEQEFEKELKSDLSSMLTKVVGPGNFTVQVNARLNFDKKEVQTKTYSPVVDDKGIVRSKEEHSETRQDSTTETGGEPGVSSNTPQGNGTTQYQSNDQGQTTSYQSSDVITNYEINEKIEKQEYAPGQVDQLSVSVMLNSTDDEEMVEKIQNSVQAAIGYNPERNDNVSVTSLNFDRSLEEEVAQAQSDQMAAQTRRMYIYAGLIALILVLLITAFIVLRRSTAEESYQTGSEVDFTVGEEMEQAEKQAAPTTELSEEEKQRRQMKEELEGLVNDKPEEVAQVLKSWLMEE